ncbi:MAG: GxxExxY protein [Thermoguttaceae bacterium]
MLETERYALMGAAFEVYNQLGYGMAEEVYQHCLAIELNLRGIPFLSKPRLEVVGRKQMPERDTEIAQSQFRRIQPPGCCRSLPG